MSQRTDAWSRRKARVREEAQAEARAQREAAARRRDAELADTPEAQVLADLGLPAPEDMQAGDDFAAFLSDAVPLALRNRALRRLWLTNPTLANLDDLLEYGEDFTGAGQGAGLVATAYRVGKGFAAPMAEPESPEAPQVAGVAPAEENAPEPVAPNTAEPVTGSVTGPVTGLATAPEAQAAAEPAPAPRPRHMQFRFEPSAATNSEEAPA